MASRAWAFMMPGRAQLAATADAKVTCGDAMWFSKSRRGPAPPPARITEIDTCRLVRAKALGGGGKAKEG